MQILLRPGSAREFDYCKRLYFSGMETILRELQLDLDKQASSFEESWDWEQVRIISLDGAEVGWLQCFTQGDAVFLAQLFVDSAFQQRGIGTRADGSFDPGSHIGRTGDDARCSENESFTSALSAPWIRYHA
jgi:hypothetical protein